LGVRLTVSFGINCLNQLFHDPFSSMTSVISKGRQRPDLLKDPVPSLLYRLTGPMIFGLAAIILFNVVDAYYIAQLGTEQLAALTYTFPATFAFISFNIGFGTATSALVANALGRGDKQGARKIVTYGLLLAAIVVFCLAIIGNLTIEPFFRLIGAEGKVLGFIKVYMQVWYSGIVFLTIPMVVNAAIRGAGNTKIPSIIMSVAALLNGVLDPLLIFGLGPFPEMGMQGAALSSLISWIGSMSAAIYVLNFHERLLLKAGFHWQHLKETWKQVSEIAVPAIASNLLTPISLGILTALVTRYGEEAVASTGVGTRLESVLVIVSISMSSALPGIIGQNFGAGLKHRVVETMMAAFKFVMIWQLVAAVCLWIAAPAIANLFSDNDKVIDLVIFYLRILPFSYGFLALTFVSTSTFNAMKKPRQAMLINMIRLLVFYIPLSFVGAWFGGIKGIYLGAAAGNVCAGLVAFYWCNINCRSECEGDKP